MIPQLIKLIISKPNPKEAQGLHKLNDIESESQITSPKPNDFHHIDDIESNVNNNAHNSFYLYMITGVLATIAIISVSLATLTTTSDSLIINSNRHLLEQNSEDKTVFDSTLNDVKAVSTDTDINRVQSATNVATETNPSNAKISIEELIIPKVAKNSVEDKVLGTLLGSAIGDALGVPLEFHFGPNRLYKNIQGQLVGRKIGDELFQTWTDVVDVAKNNMTKYPGRHTEYLRAVDLAMQMKGGGYFRAKPGMSSDDTAMAIQMARGFIATSNGKPNNSAVNVKDVQQNNFEQYFKWANPNRNKTLTFNGYPIRNKPFDIGLTIGGIYNSEGTLNVETVLNKTKEANKVKYEQFGSGLWSNGALMRIAPMAVYCMHLKPDEIYKVVEADLALTNNNPFATMATTTYVLMMREMINGKSPNDAFMEAQSFLKAREPIDGLDGVGKHEVNGNMVIKYEKPSTVILRWIDEIREKDSEQPECCDKEPISIITMAFKQAIWYLNAWSKNGINNPSYTDIMRHILLGKGDTDTNAAIVGSMLGASLGIHGIYNEPDGRYWLDTLLSCSVEPHPRVIKGTTSEFKNEYEADHNPYLAKVYIEEDIWQKLIDVAPKFLIGYDKHFYKHRERTQPIARIRAKTLPTQFKK